MTTYKARGNAIVDQTGRQIAVVLPANCTKKLAREMAAYAAQQANHAEQQRVRNAAAKRPGLTDEERAYCGMLSELAESPAGSVRGADGVRACGGGQQG